jgi:GDPmannose 4,6-dehydratase
MNILNIADATSLINNRKVVFITGVTGQDGSHMADYLLKNTDYMIFGGVRRLSVPNRQNINHLENNARFALVNFDLSDVHSINNIIKYLMPDYFINLAAQTFVGSSWDFPSQTWECNTTGVLHILEALRQYNSKCRFYNAGSSEEYGDVEYSPQDEKHPMKPRSPYGASKSAARQLVKVYRESYNMYLIQGLLFNHEGTRRGEEFVTRKITKGVARIKKALLEGKNFNSIELGNVYAKRDWSDAEDFVDAIWRMLNQEKFRNDFDSNMQIQEYVVSSNETHTIKEFIELAFKTAGVDGGWHGNGLNEEYSISVADAFKYDPINSVLIKINPKFYRPAEVDLLLGNSNLARRELGWQPKTSFNQLVEKMVLNDLKLEGLL